MRYIVTVFVIVFCAKNIFSQVEEGFAEDLDKYVGTWVCKSSNEEFKIVLKKGRYNVLMAFDCVLGGYYYKKNDRVFDYLHTPYSEANYNTSKYIGIIASNASSEYSTIKVEESLLFFKDFTLKKSSSCSQITLLSPTTIRWQLFEDEGDYVEDMPPAGFSVPADVILTKVQ